MPLPEPNSTIERQPKDCSKLAPETALPVGHLGEKMARRRHQKPVPFREGNFWYLRFWDAGLAGNRKRKRIRLAPATMSAREVAKIAEENWLP